MKFTNKELCIICNALEEYSAQIEYILENNPVNQKTADGMDQENKEVCKLWDKVRGMVTY